MTVGNAGKVRYSLSADGGSSLVKGPHYACWRRDTLVVPVAQGAPRTDGTIADMNAQRPPD
jgi:hypothetical protein